MLISLDSWIVVWWWFAYCFLILVFWWCDCDSLVDEWSVWWRGGVGWIVRRVAVWLGWWLLYLMWFMEFGVTVWLWSDGVTRVVVVGITGDSGGQVKLILNIDWSLWWLVDWWFWLWLMGSLVGCDDEWWMMIRCFEIDDWCFGCGLLVTCYLVLMFFVFVWLSQL